MFSFLVSKGKSRDFQGKSGLIVNALAMAVGVYHIYTFASGDYEMFSHRSVHVGSILAFCFLTFSHNLGSTKGPFFMERDIVWSFRQGARIPDRASSPRPCGAG